MLLNLSESVGFETGTNDERISTSWVAQNEVRALQKMPWHYLLMTFLKERMEIISLRFFLSIRFLKHSVTIRSISLICRRYGACLRSKNSKSFCCNSSMCKLSILRSALSGNWANEVLVLTPRSLAFRISSDEHTNCQKWSTRNISAWKTFSYCSVLASLNWRLSVMKTDLRKRRKSSRTLSSLLGSADFKWLAQENNKKLQNRLLDSLSITLQFLSTRTNSWRWT